MKITEGIHWVLTCTPNFEQTVALFRDVLGLAVTAEGIPTTDLQFTRHAQIMNHGVEHRTNITTILNQGLQTPPDVDGWGYLAALPDRFDYKAGL